MERNRPKLKRCPFCGGRAALQVWSVYRTNKVAVKCIRCGARTRAASETVELCAMDEVSDEWNRRATLCSWTSVEESMPVNQLPVLGRVAYPDDEYETRIVFYDGKKWQDNFSDEKIGDVIAWMELPKYSEVKND